jgi:hypothetical protein
VNCKPSSSSDINWTELENEADVSGNVSRAVHGFCNPILMPVNQILEFRHWGKWSHAGSRAFYSIDFSQRGKPYLPVGTPLMAMRPGRINELLKSMQTNPINRFL